MRLFKRKQKLTPHQQLRREFAFFGYDLTSMTDEELEDGVNNAANVISKVGLTIDEVEEACRMFSNLHKELNKQH